MRLVRLGEATSKVAADLKAALAAWGSGDTILGGVALLGYQPPGHPRPVDAVLVLPGAVLVVVGVDLPDPALKLDAPLSGQWRIDGWPLVSPTGTVNPASEAVTATAAITAHLRPVLGESARLGVIVAVGPYVSEVTQPEEDLAGGARVLHPKPSTLLTCAQELATGPRMSAARAAAVLAALHPDAPTGDLAAEGFAEQEQEHEAVEAAAAPKQRQDKSRQDRQRPEKSRGETARPEPQLPPVPAPAKAEQKTGTGKPRKWLPIGAAAAVVVLIGAGIVAALVTGSSSRAVQPQTATVDGTNYTRADSTQDGTGCGQHSYGDLQVWLGAHPCADLRRWSYSAEVNGRNAALAVAEVGFADAKVAEQFRAAAAKPGGGGIADLVREGRGWPGGPSSFDRAAFSSAQTGAKVRLVEAVWASGASSPEDADLTALTKRTLSLPLTD
ncbi:hypothetical protein GCM10010174_55280 [Kutzneria viridogrisea]|uniref:Nuclease-like protein n=1 Tax=Kutzneria viridogrisea TaxID=47990 RepID=A0ABR6BKL7_9PSEU|nr:hypothetical protein [Kutzneria viridogrisea]